MLFNVMQFLGTFAAVTSIGLDKDIYDDIPVQVALSSETCDGAELNITDEWAEEMQYISAEAKNMAHKLITIGSPAPTSIGFELENAAGVGVAEAEIAWEEQHIVYLTPEQAEFRSIFEAEGWTVITDDEEPMKNIFERGRN